MIHVVCIALPARGWISPTQTGRGETQKSVLRSVQRVRGRRLQSKWKRSRGRRRGGKKYKSQWQGQPAYCSKLHSVFMEMWHIPTAMDGSHSKTYSIHKHWLFISERNWISQKKKSRSDCKGTALPCPCTVACVVWGRTAAEKHRAILSPCHACVIKLNAPLFCSVGWIMTQHPGMLNIILRHETK